MIKLLMSLITLFSFSLALALSTIDLNTATQAEIEALPGIGPAIAKRIIEARPLKSVEDLKNIKGMGNKADKIKDMVSVGGTTGSGVNTNVARESTTPTQAPAATLPTTAAPIAKEKIKKVKAPELALGEMISLNSATKEDLMKLPGIGPKKADAIIQNRPYSNLDDVKKVKGIKDGIFNKIKNNIKL